MDKARLTRFWHSRQFGVYLMTIALVGWLCASITIQFAQALHFGYGTGIGDGGRIPPAIVEHYGTSDRETLVRMTMRDNWWNIFNRTGENE